MASTLHSLTYLLMILTCVCLFKKGSTGGPTPDCPHGDQNEQLCASIQPTEPYGCYQHEQTCCATCGNLVDEDRPDCRYGDKDEFCLAEVAQRMNWCYEQESECCDTCSLVVNENSPDCRYGDKDTWDSEIFCLFMPPSGCDDNEIRDTCCQTCEFFISNENCEFGNRAPDCVDNIWPSDCYNETRETECCGTCAGYILFDLPYSCRYGSKGDLLINCSAILPSDCYNDRMEDICCKECHEYVMTEDLGTDCRFGDRHQNCEMLEINPCYNETSRLQCCQFCQERQNGIGEEIGGCEYGDKYDNCTMISALDCQYHRESCCLSCRLHNSDNGPCANGDLLANCSSISDYMCYDFETEVQCCDTCSKREKGNPGCLYGDWNPQGCEQVHSKPWKCYEIEYPCCYSCPMYRDDDNPDCWYGDKAETCMDIHRKPWKCYMKQIEEECCHSCPMYRNDDTPDCLYGDTNHEECSIPRHCYSEASKKSCCHSCPRYMDHNNPDCPFGDKLKVCLEIHNATRWECYRREQDCCHTCPIYRDQDNPGCEYGDKHAYCDPAQCRTYDPRTRQECCHTCRDYSHRTTSVYTTTESLSTTPSTSEASSATESGNGQTDKQNSDSIVAPIVGGVVGNLCVIAVIVVVVLYILRRRRNRDKANKQNASNAALEIRHSQAVYSNNVANVTNVDDYSSVMSAAPTYMSIDSVSVVTMNNGAFCYEEGVDAERLFHTPEKKKTVADDFKI